MLLARCKAPPVTKIVAKDSWFRGRTELAVWLQGFIQKRLHFLEKHECISNDFFFHLKYKIFYCNRTYKLEMYKHEHNHITSTWIKEQIILLS